MSEAIQQTRNAAGQLESMYARFELIDEIVERLSEGEPLRAICRSPGMPHWRTVYHWLDADPQAATAIARARDEGHDAIAIQALQIADDKSGDPQRDKLRIETRLKLLAKWNPKKYGDSTQIKHADANGDKLDTATLVNELLSVMGSASNGAPITLINVTPGQEVAASGYKPPEERIKLRRAPVTRTVASDVDDLV